MGSLQIDKGVNILEESKKYKQFCLLFDRMRFIISFIWIFVLGNYGGSPSPDNDIHFHINMDGGSETSQSLQEVGNDYADYADDLCEEKKNQQLVQKINEYRRNLSLPEFICHEDLVQTAKEHTANSN